ncbi:hypothetical protein [Haladaptatus halobius]|nr:hypothetical protein [Haladaptatus halobius]
MRNLLTRLAGRSQSTVIVECRHCGTAVSVEASDCPRFGHDGIAIYRFD